MASAKSIFSRSSRADLNRQDWDGTPQALRSSLNEIRDAYIPTCIPSEYQALGVVICLVFGGDIKEAVHQEVRGYIRSNTTANVTYEEWNGDRLADLILTGILREDMFNGDMRSHLRKAAAMVEEPDIAYAHFQQLVDAIVKRPARKQIARISKAREIYMCLWVLFTSGARSEQCRSALPCERTCGSAGMGIVERDDRQERPRGGRCRYRVQ